MLQTNLVGTFVSLNGGQWEVRAVYENRNDGQLWLLLSRLGEAFRCAAVGDVRPVR